jgi:D-3-phosphoglycerate dehydrogenase
MRVIACDVRPVAAVDGVEMVDRERLARESDVLSIHIHLTPANTGLIDRHLLMKMKSGAVLINTSRGAIVNEADLLHVLESGHLGGAGLDVIEGEWNDNLIDHPLIRYSRMHENLVISPHVGGVTFESQAMVCGRTVEKLADYLRTLA